MNHELLIQTQIQDIQHQFESLSAHSVPALAALYALDARFKDPFNAVQGRDKIARIFSHMFETVQAPRFAVTKIIANIAPDESDVCLRWDFHFVRNHQSCSIVGATHLVLDATGKIAMHDDYWDAAEQVYERVPLLGAVLRWIKRRISA